MADVSNWLTHIPRPFRRRTSTGAVPGTILVDPDAPRSRIHVTEFDAENLVSEDIDDVAQLADRTLQLPVRWIDIDGLGNADVIRAIGQKFGLHRLALEDVVHIHQRPKVEEYDDHLFVIVRAASLIDHITFSQISLFLGKDYVITFREGVGHDPFSPVRERLQTSSGRIRNAGADYLAYALTDAAIDTYFPILDTFGSWIEALDDELAKTPLDSIHRLRQLRNELLSLRTTTWSHREALSILMRHPTELVAEETRLYLRDCQDHASQILDVIDTQRELVADLRDLHFTMLSNRTNETMKVLTIIATIFIPLGFITGLYGMNFDPNTSPWNMPELHWFYGYPFALGLMGCCVTGLLYFIWRRGWFD